MSTVVLSEAHRHICFRASAVIRYHSPRAQSGAHTATRPQSFSILLQRRRRASNHVGGHNWRAQLLARSRLAAIEPVARCITSSDLLPDGWGGHMLWSWRRHQVQRCEFWPMNGEHEVVVDARRCLSTALVWPSSRLSTITFHYKICRMTFPPLIASGRPARSRIAVRGSMPRQ